MDPIFINKIISAIEFEKSLEETSKKAIIKAINSIFDYVKFKLDPWSRRAYKKQLINVLKERQIEYVSNAIAKINEIKVGNLQKFQTEEQIINETLKYLQSPVFIEFVNNISKSSFNWKGGARKEEKVYHEEEAWWDKFCELMNKRHERWRAKLFAEALKIQTTGMGYVGYTTLWKIASLPPHSWIDLTQFLSLSGEIWVNDEYKMSVIPGAFSKISQLDYSLNDGRRRLVSDLETSLTDDGLTRTESGPIVLKKSDDNKFILNNRVYDIIVDPNYEDPYLTDENLQDDEFLKKYFRMFGIWLSYIGEEIIQLASEKFVHKEAEDLFNKYRIELEGEDGILFKERKIKV
jgi:hypothetical protein